MVFCLANASVHSRIPDRQCRAKAAAVVGGVNADVVFSSVDIDDLVGYLNSRPEIPAPLLVEPSSYDVDGLGCIGQLDAIKLRNFLEDHWTSSTYVYEADKRFDVDGDGHTTNLDLLLVVNELNARLGQN